MKVKKLVNIMDCKPLYITPLLTIVILFFLLGSPALAGGIMDKIGGEIVSCFSGGCDPSVIIGKELRRKSSKIGEGLAEPVRVEFEKGVNNVFDQNIYPLLKKIDTLSHDRISQIGEVTNDVLTKAIGNAIDGMDKLLDDFASIAQTFSPSEIQQKIILAASTELNNILNKFFNQVNAILDRVDISVDKLDCKAEGFSTALKNDLTKIANSFSPINLLKQSACRKDLKINLLKPDFQLTNSEFYLLTRCLIENQMNKDVTVKQILGYYADIQGTAKRMRCVERGSSNASDFYTKEYIELGDYYNAWKNN
jgi:hypothetical protein